MNLEKKVSPLLLVGMGTIVLALTLTPLECVQNNRVGQRRNDTQLSCKILAHRISITTSKNPQKVIVALKSKPIDELRQLAHNMAFN